MNKRYILIFTIIALLLASCEADLNNIDSAVKTASVTLKITNNTESRSILPEVTKIASYSVTLQNKASEDVKYTASFKEGDNITIDSVLVGEYTVTVDGCSDIDASIKVATGTTNLTVKTDGDNTASVTLDWLDEGTGSFSVDIDWAGLTKEDNFLYKAIQNKSLGFQAWDTESKKPFNDAEIQWVDDASFTAKTFKYTQTNIPTQKDKRSTNISFRIYSEMEGENQVIAETFYTTVTIFANITSYPDGNESFSLKNENIVYYLKNVTNVTSSLNSENSAKKVDISWTYPSLNDGKYLLKVWITNNDTGNIVGEEKNVEYCVLNTVATGATTATFDGVTPDYSYTVHFINYTNDANLVYSYSAETTPLTNIKTKVKVTSISFASGFGASYVMGDSVSVNANIAPGDATITGYTVSAPDLAVKDKTVTFDKSGDYTITITSDDEDAVQKTASTTVTVRLATPQNFTLEKTAEGMALSWSSVDSATSYSIKKTSSDGEETLIPEGTSYTDSSVKTGVEYTYSVKAVRSDDAKFDSDFTEEKKGTIKNTFITVTAPANVTSENFKPILEAALKGQFVTDLKGITVTIDTSSSTLLSSENTTITWLLSGEKIGTENSRTVDIDRTNVDINAHESSNSLQLVVTKDGITYSAAATVHYIETDPGELTITTEESTVKYKVPLQLEISTANNVDCAISWTSSNPEVATVDSDGKVTALIDGETTITATIVATGKRATKTIRTYIPVKSITIENENKSCNFLLANHCLTDYGKNNYTTTTLELTFVGENNKEASAEAKKKVDWSISGGCANLDKSYGKVTSLSNGGIATITVTSTDENSNVSGSISIPVYKFDIYAEIGGAPITGQDYTIEFEFFKWTEKQVFALVCGSTDNTNKFDFSWSKENVTGAQNEIKNGNTYCPTLRFNSNTYDCEIYVSIKLKNETSPVATMMFNRKS